MSFANRKKIYVATYKEIIIGFIVFCIILLVLYPKEQLTKEVLQESSNYDLSILYLENMLKNDPSNEALMLSLAKQAFKAGKKDLSYRLLKLLKNSHKQEIRENAYLLSYQIAKEDYFYLKKAEKKTALHRKYKELQELFHTIIAQHYYKETQIQQLYQESYFLHDTTNEYFLVQKLLQKHPNDIKLLSDAFYLSVKTNNYEKAMHYLNTLALLDKKHHNKWLDERYYLLAKHYSYKETESFLLQHAQNSAYWEKKLVSFYLGHKQYKKVAQLYMNRFRHTSHHKQQLQLWLQAIETLRAGGYTKDALRLGYRYENYFFHDKKARIALLKLYISANDLKKAKQLSKKILKIKR
jgi:hypothetical protein